MHLRVIIKPLKIDKKAVNKTAVRNKGGQE